LLAQRARQILDVILESVLLQSHLTSLDVPGLQL